LPPRSVGGDHPKQVMGQVKQGPGRAIQNLGHHFFIHRLTLQSSFLRSPSVTKTDPSKKPAPCWTTHTSTSTGLADHPHFEGEELPRCDEQYQRIMVFKGDSRPHRTDAPRFALLQTQS